jgi:hypothetical protein
MDNGYDTQDDEYKKRERELENLSTVDRIKYRNLETKYEIAKQTGEDVPEDKQQYILSQIFKNRR